MFKKIATLLVKKRLVFMIIMLVLTIVAAFMWTRVKTSTDMSRYLANSSSMKQGLTIMEEEFPTEDDSGVVRVMTTGLSSSELATLENSLSVLPGVESVTHSGTSGTHDLLILNLFDGTSTRTVTDELAQDFANDGLVWDTNESSPTTVPMLILVIAVALLLVILLVMSPSWIEPLLFLVVSLMAIVLNFGTNLILGSVADITTSIGPVLQLVLAMDYSVILLNRYRSCRAQGQEKTEAMTAALAQSAPAIAASALTTIVGLIMMSFLSFKIGLELGLVLAKGVALSLLTVFLVLPGLVLLSDAAIAKTRKATPKLALRSLTRLSIKGRVLVPVLFLALVTGATVLQTKSTIKYTENETDEVATVFPKDNTMILLHDKSDTAGIQELLATLSADEHVKSITSYETTIGKELDASSLASSLALDPTLVRLLYYVEHDGTVPATSVTDLVTFLNEDVLTNEAYARLLTPALKEGIARLAGIANVEALTSELTALELASFFSLSTEQAELVILSAKANDASFAPSSMTLSAYVTFLTEVVMTDSRFASAFTKETQESLLSLRPFTVKSTLTLARSRSELAQALSLSTDTIASLFTKAFGDDPDATMSLSAALAGISADQDLLSSLTSAEQERITLLNAVATSVLADDLLTPADAAILTGLDLATTRLLFTFHDLKTGRVFTLTPVAFVKVLQGLDALHDSLSTEQQATLTSLARLMSAVTEGTRFTPDAMASLLSALLPASDALTSDSMTLLYLALATTKFFHEDWTMSLESFVTALANAFANAFAEANAFLISTDEAARIESARVTIETAKTSLVGEQHARIIITTDYAVESKETDEAITRLATLRNESFTKTTFLIGESELVHELSGSFKHEYIVISLLTALAIALVVFFTFRSFVIPLLLVLLVESAVQITVAVTVLQGNSIYYLAMLIVQSILMGATIDYAIVMTTFYREHRSHEEIPLALGDAYRDAMPTILTSGSILVVVTALLGIFTARAIADVCLTIAIGSLASLLAIVIVLPCLLSLLDRFVCKKGLNKTS